MKKILLLFVCSVLGITGFAEEVIGYYSMSYFTGKETLKIEASEPKNGMFTYYIEVTGESASDKVYMSVKSSNVESFRETLRLIRNKYTEWCKIAVENNITEMNKEFSYKLYNISFAWYGSKWWFSGDYTLTPKFCIMDDGQMIILVYKKAVSRNNEYIDQECYLVFNSVAEIDKLIEGTNPQIVYDYFNNKSSEEDLFQ